MAIACSSVSIHAPTQGATERYYYDHEAIKVSIHAPTQGATARIFGNGGHFPVSIHAPTQGATVIRLHGVTLSVFQSTRPRRARHIIVFILYKIPSFNPRAHAGRDQK